MKEEEEEEGTELLVYISSRFSGFPPTSVVSGSVLHRDVPGPALGISQTPPHGPSAFLGTRSSEPTPTLSEPPVPDRPPLPGRTSKLQARSPRWPRGKKQSGVNRAVRCLVTLRSRTSGHKAQHSVFVWTPLSSHCPLCGVTPRPGSSAVRSDSWEGGEKASLSSLRSQHERRERQRHQCERCQLERHQRERQQRETSL